MTAERPQMRSVYPAHWIDPIIGRHTAALNQAIECWAAQISHAQQSLTFLSARDWELLASLLQDEVPSPRDPNPGRSIARMLSDWPGLDSPIEHVRRVINLAHGLTYDQTWAVIVAVQFHKRNPAVKLWWTLGVRKEQSDE